MKCVWVAVVGACVICWGGSESWAGPPLGFNPFSGSKTKRTTLIDGRPVVRSQQKQQTTNIFTWFAQQGRQLWDQTRRWFSGEPKPQVRRRVGRMEFPFLGNRPKTKQKPSFWSRWWPWSNTRK